MHGSRSGDLLGPCATLAFLGLSDVAQGAVQWRVGCGDQRGLAGV